MKTTLDHVQDAKQALKKTGLPMRTLRLNLERGVLTLRGQVENHYQKYLAGKTLRALDGVEDVHNYLRINRQAKKPIRLEALKAKLEPEISMTLNCQTVHLRGQVNSWQERMEVERAVLLIPGINSVESSLIVATRRQ